MLKLILSLLGLLQNWENCGTSTDHINNLVITYPDVISIHDDINIEIKGDIDEELVSGKINYKIYLRGIQVYNGKIDICSQVDCPLEKGIFSIKTKQKMPNKVLPGKYQIEMEGYDQNNEELFCAKLDFKIKL